MSKITIASYTPFLKDVDDAILKKYLTNRGNKVEIVSWDDKNYNWKETDLVIIRSTWDYYKKIDEYIAWLKNLKEKDVFVLNDVDVILNNIKKENQIEWIKENKLSIPETYVFSKYNDNCLYPEDTLIKTLEKYYKKDVNKKMFVLKSSISAYTEKVYLVDPYNINKDKNCKVANDYEAAFNEMLNKGETKKLIIQEYLPGIKDGEYGLVFINQKFTWAVVKKPGRIYGEESMIHIYKKDIPKDVLNYAQKIAKLYDKDKVLYCRVDLVVSNNKTYLMEIELAEPDLYVRIGDHIALDIVNPDYYLPLVERKGCKSVRINKICEAIEEKIQKKL